jgi:DivIVA domain-containing protein
VTWVFAVVVVGVLAVVAVVATGRGGELGPAYDDRRDVRVQADGPLTAEDLAEVRFTTALRGYRASEVDALLDRLVTEMRGRAQVELRPEAGPPPERSPDSPLDSPPDLPPDSPPGHAGPVGRPGT